MFDKAQVRVIKRIIIMPQFEWDENAVEFRGNSPDELRVIRIGRTLSKLLIAVVYVVRLTVIRIISARQANKKEIKSYLENSLSKQSKDESES